MASTENNELIKEERSVIAPSIEYKLVLTGTVYDLATSAVGAGLTVTAFTGNAEPYTVLTSVPVDSSGTYYIVIDKNIIPIDANGNIEGGPTTINLCVFQKGKQLEMDEVKSITVDSLKNQKLVDLNVYSLPSIKGKLKRWNHTPASACLVELYETQRNTLLGSAMTDIDGNYEIPYDIGNNAQTANLTAAPKLMLKFYNNEDIIYQEDGENNENQIVVELTKIQDGVNAATAYAAPEYIDPYPSTENSLPATRSKTYTKPHFVDEIEIEVDEQGKTYYYQVNSATKRTVIENGADIDYWDTTETLIYLKDEKSESTKITKDSTDYILHINDVGSNNESKCFWRIIKNGSNYYKVLQQFVMFDPSGKNRIVYSHTVDADPEGTPGTTYEKSPLAEKIILKTSIVGDTSSLKNVEPDFDGGNAKYFEEIEYFRASSSPQIFTVNRIETINFRFTRDSLDLYTRIKNRNIEYYPESGTVVAATE